MAKPTRPFGTIVFGKDGSVRQDISTLPSDKAGQETGVAERFVPFAQQWVGPVSGFEILPEYDHDFRILPQNGPPVLVQCTEVTFREMRLPEGAQSNYWVAGKDEHLTPIDSSKMVSILAEKIQHKLLKRYSKPAREELWLLIWSVSGFQLGSFIQAGRNVSSPAVVAARALMSETDPGPFARIVYFDMLTRPTMILPVDGEPLG